MKHITSCEGAFKTNERPKWKKCCCLHQYHSVLTHLLLWWPPSRWSTPLGLLGSHMWGMADRWARCSGWGWRWCPAPSERCRCRRSWGCSRGERWSASRSSSPSTRWSDSAHADPARPPIGQPESTCINTHSRGQRSRLLKEAVK